MITEIIRYQIDPAEAASFIETYREAMAIVDETGFALSWEILQQDEDTSLFHIIIRWQSREAHLSGFRQSSSFARFFAKVKPYFQSILEIQHYSNK
ncbi:hypothetical protein GCM10011613_25940 [Cellvibrio zantedeschiae]|uniref:ABM domain-containing protein n=1 Tax=Cellvibrio zantedeschiae TaxID=1237077 RepID=A0ABQ3B585_9GAMM|nr:antibiotic biosynthesis monooxygenase family protein [Cellvibrio zantedeschiae]GGY79792.1 hypothetical protein GCM10011613_25940 [Cellvibrio zantedeschiae]